MARDIQLYLEAEGVDGPVSLVGHSMGGKVAMTYAQMFPDQVKSLITIDQPPVDRNIPKYDHLNNTTRQMIEGALQLGDLTSLGYQRAKQLIQTKITDPVLMSALVYNLHQMTGEWLCNLASIAANQKNIYGFDRMGTYEGPTLVINGEQSFLSEMQRDASVYREGGLTAVQQSDIIMVAKAGHNVHFDQPRLVK